MAQCAYCQAEAKIFSRAAPVCAECSQKQAATADERQTLEALIEDVMETSTRKTAASEAFETAISQFPSGLPPDGAHRINSTSAELSVARKELMRAHVRLNDFRNRKGTKSYKQSA
jgi:hypothetical protein